MAYEYNPLSGQFDIVGGAAVISAAVATPADLPITLGTPAVGVTYLAQSASGTWFVNYRPAGLYRRTANVGTAADWQYLGAFPEANRDDRFRIYNSADTTKQVAFDVSGISTGTTRTLIAPDASGTVVVSSFDGVASFKVDGGFLASLDCSANSANRTYEFPDASGTVMLGSLNLASLTNTATARTNLGLGLIIPGTNQIEQYSGTSAQRFDLYNTRTDASNFERLSLRWAGNAILMDVNQSGTGVQRTLSIQRNGTSVIDFTNPVQMYGGFHVMQASGSVNIWQVFRADNKYVGVMSDHRFVWCNSATGSFFSGPTIDTGLGRNAAGVVEVNNGTLGTFRDLLARDLTLVPSASRTLSVNGHFAIEATSNTQLTFRYRGSDGTTRSNTLTLA